MPIKFAPLHSRLVFNTPLSNERSTELVTFLTRYARGSIVDVGCGWAELLMRVLEANDAVHGVGIDLSAADFEHANSVAGERGIAGRLEMICGDVKDRLPELVQGAICIGASQIWGPPVEANQPLDYSAALAALRKLVSRGAPVVYGEAIWSKAPTDAAVAPLAGRMDEFVFLPQLIELASKHSFAVVRVHEATLDEWDVFESGHQAKYALWLSEHPTEHPDAAEVQTLARRQQEAYFGGYRGILGMAYLSLLAV
jgi:hypothetical protein